MVANIVGILWKWKTLLVKVAHLCALSDSWQEAHQNGQSLIVYMSQFWLVQVHDQDTIFQLIAELCLNEIPDLSISSTFTI